MVKGEHEDPGHGQPLPRRNEPRLFRRLRNRKIKVTITLVQRGEKLGRDSFPARR